MNQKTIDNMNDKADHLTSFEGLRRRKLPYDRMSPDRDELQQQVRNSETPTDSKSRQCQEEILSPFGLFIEARDWLRMLFFEDDHSL